MIDMRLRIQRNNRGNRQKAHEFKLSVSGRFLERSTMDAELKGKIEDKIIEIFKQFESDLRKIPQVNVQSTEFGR